MPRLTRDYLETSDAPPFIFPITLFAWTILTTCNCTFSSKIFFLTLQPPRQPVPSWNVHLYAFPPLSPLLWLHLPPCHLHRQPRTFHSSPMLRQACSLACDKDPIKPFLKPSLFAASLTPKVCASTPSITTSPVCSGPRTCNWPLSQHFIHISHIFGLRSKHQFEMRWTHFNLIISRCPGGIPARPVHLPGQQGGSLLPGTLWEAQVHCEVLSIKPAVENFGK